MYKSQPHRRKNTPTMPLFNNLQNGYKLDLKFIKVNSPSPNPVISSTNRFSQIQKPLNYTGKIKDSNVAKKSYVHEPIIITKNRLSNTPTKQSTNRSQPRNRSPSILPENFRLSDSQWYCARKYNSSSSNSSTFFEASSANDSPKIILEDDNFECDSTSQNLSGRSNEKPRRGRKSLVEVSKSRKKESVKELTQRKPRSKVNSTVQRRSVSKAIVDSSDKSQELFSSEEYDLFDDVQFVCQSKAVLPSPEYERSQCTPKKNASHKGSKTKETKDCNTPKSTKSLRYPLRSITTISPVIYDLPDTRVRRRSSILTVDNSPETMKEMKPRVSSKKPTTPKRCTESRNSFFSSFQSSQDTYVCDSLEILGQKTDTCDQYEFIPSPPTISNRSRKASTKRKNGSGQNQITPKTSKSSVTKNMNQLFEISSTTCNPSSQPEVNRTPKNAKLQNTKFVSEKLPKPLNEKISKSQTTEKVSKPRPKKVIGLRQPQKTVSLSPRKPPTNVLKDIKNTPKTPTRNPKILQESSSSSGLTSASYDDLSQQLRSIFIDQNTPQTSQKSIGTNPFFSFNSSNSTQSFNFGMEKNNSQLNFNCSYGNLLARTNNSKQNETDIQELCDLFSQLKIEDRTKLRRLSFLSYRDPNVKEKPYMPLKLIAKTPTKVRTRESRFSNFHRDFNLSPKKSTPKSTTPKPKIKDILGRPKISLPTFQLYSKDANLAIATASKPVKKEMLSRPKIDLPTFQLDAPKNASLDVSAVLRRVTHIERTLPNYFHFNGEECGMDGYKEWN